MTVAYDLSYRGSSSTSSACLEDRFEVLKEIGDGSFGSVVLARVRSGGAHVARRGTVVAIKTMKKTFDSFASCLELREIVFLRTLPNHAHLVPALDIFLDPFTKKLHVCMEYMDGNLYQLMKSRDHKWLDGSSVKSILFQILSGLEHIHANSFFHRDIKPENILVSTSAPQESAASFRRYSALVTPPSTPPLYTVKIADFGLCRETHSKLPYTTYVSTRWYRAPEVLLRAGEYSAPVDIWAVGAMAVEVATLKPLFPGGNEVDQVWRVCEIMGSPGNWYSKNGEKVGGGDWREGTRLAQKLGFSFPKMAPHSMDTILQAPQWPSSLSSFVTWCLMWDPKNRPTSSQALNHEYFTDAVDPLRPKSSASKKLNRKHSDLYYKSTKDTPDMPTLSSKPSWFRKSLIGRDLVQAVQSQTVEPSPIPPRPAPVHSNTTGNLKAASKPRPSAEKRTTWTHGLLPVSAAPMPILPSIRPISPLSDAVTAQGNARSQFNPTEQDQSGTTMDEAAAKKIGRQLSIASHGNHYPDMHRQDAERALNGSQYLANPLTNQKEGFFSHLRKRARRLSGRHGVPLSPNADDLEANAGSVAWPHNRSSMTLDSPEVIQAQETNDFAELDRALQNVRYSLDGTTVGSGQLATNNTKRAPSQNPAIGLLKRQHSFSQKGEPSSTTANAPISSRTRRALQMTTHPVHHYETPDEEEELLDEVITSAHNAAKHLNLPTQAADRQTAKSDVQSGPPRLTMPAPSGLGSNHNPYPTPSPSAKRNSYLFGQSESHARTSPIDIAKSRVTLNSVENHWPTPPYDENEWAEAAAASIFAVGATFR